MRGIALSGVRRHCRTDFAETVGRRAGEKLRIARDGDHPESHLSALDHLLGGAAVDTGDHVVPRAGVEDLGDRVGVRTGYYAQRGRAPQTGREVGRAHVDGVYARYGADV